MDRGFNKTIIDERCGDLNTIISECDTYLEELMGYGSAVRAAFEEVIGKVPTGGLESALSTFNAQAVGIDFAEFKRSILAAKSQVELIAATDSAYSDNTAALKAQADAVKSVLSGIYGFMGEFSLSRLINPQSFISQLEAKSVTWKKELEDAQKVINQIRANSKGQEALCVAFSKDPVNLSTGNLIYDKEDFKIASAVPFVFRRFYNSINTRKGSLGKDWIHNFEVRIMAEGEERVLLLEAGKEERFIKTATGDYLSLYHSNGTLFATETGYLYQMHDQTRYYFDQEGYYLAQELPDGTRTTLHYETVEGKKILTKAERGTGEAFCFFYTEEKRLSKVTDHTGRSVTYRVFDDQLVEVCSPKGHRYRYGYARNGKLEYVENPRKVITLENTYDERQRTIHQAFPDKTTMSFQYDDEKRSVTVTERNDSQITYVHDEKYRDIRHIYRDGEERFEYNQGNQKTLVVDKAGNKTQFGYDQKGNMTRMINALGSKTEFSYNQANQLTHMGINGITKVRNHYDDAGNLIETTDALGHTYCVTYQEKRPIKITKPDGSTQEISHDARGNIVQLIEASGSTIRYAYDDLNRICKTIDGNGNETWYSYDEEDNVISVTNANGDTRYYEYNESNQVTKIVDFDGSESRREYGEFNRPNKLIDQQGRETLLLYDSMWNLARITQPNGAKTTRIHDEDNRLVRIRNANGDIIRFGYDTVGNRTKITDEEGQETLLSYDALGQLTKVTKPDGSEQCYSYDLEGRVVKTTDALGNEIHMEYDAKGNLVRETGTMGEVRQYTYTPLDLLESVTDESGRKTCYQYLPGGQLESIHYPDGSTERYTYDSNGNVKTFIHRRGSTLFYSYDSLDQVIKIEERESMQAGQGEDTESLCKYFQYDSMGNVTAITDCAGNTTQYTYTLTGQLSQITDALGNKTEYTYDVCDRLIETRQYGADGTSMEVSSSGDPSEIDADLHRAKEQNQRELNCQITRYERDLSGQITSITDALGHTETFQYNKKGELLEKVDKEGYLTKYGYTPQGDVAHIQYTDGREVKLSYTPLRQLQQIQDWCGTTTIESDARGRVTGVTYPDGKEVSYTYGISGERTSMTYPDGKTVQYGYDEQLRLSQLQDGDHTIHYDYNSMGDLRHKQFPNGSKISYEYNSKGQLTSMTHHDREGILDAYQYDYDRVGNRNRIEKNRRGLEEESGIYQYEYDSLRRLSKVNKDGVLKRAYGYDAFGNRTTKQDYNQTGGIQRTTYSYNALNQLIQQTDNQEEVSYQYDRRGNLSQTVINGQVANQYLYGARNRLEQATNSQGMIAHYQYNGLGNRIGKQMEQNLAPTKTIDYTLDLTRAFHNLLQSQETEAERHMTQTYLWDNNVAGIATQTYGDASEVNETYGFYMQDELGSPIRILDQAGVNMASYGYEEFGQELYHQEGYDQPFTYTGYQKDEIAGTYFAQSREYNIYTGQFISKDQDAFLDMNRPYSLNQYAYCVSNPLRYIDPMGFDADDSVNTFDLSKFEDNYYSFTLDGFNIVTQGIGTISKYDIITAPRPNNIGAGLWKGQVTDKLDDAAKFFGASKDDVTAGLANKVVKGVSPKGALPNGTLPKVVKGLGYAGVAVSVGGGIYDNVQAGSSAEETASDAVVDGAFSWANLAASGALGGKIGAAVGSVVPGAGNIAGAVGGAIVGGVIYFATEVWQINGKSIKDHVKDGICDLFEWD